MEAIKAGLSPAQVRRLDEVADGMLKVYRTLARMQYLEDSWILEGPHDVDAFIPAWRQQGIADSIAYLYSVLPYVIDYGARGRGLDFVFGGGFTGFLHEDMTESRNPMYEQEREGYMRPWMTPLSTTGNHMAAMIYDARRHVIGIYRQLEGSSSDPSYGKVYDEHPPLSDEYDSDDDDLDKSNNWDEMKARPAPDVLRDIVLRYQNLTLLPGGGEQSGPEWEATLTKPLYIKNGWPHDFNGMSFLVDQAKSRAESRAAYDPKPGLLAKMNRFRRFLQLPPPPPEDGMTIAEYDNVENFWFERWRRFQQERSRIDVPILLQEAERAYESSGNDRQVRLLKNLRRGIRGWEKIISDGGVQENDGSPGSAQIRVAYAEKYLEVEKRVYEACKAEAGGDAFFAERAMVETDLDPAESPDPELQERSRLHIEAIRGWLVQVPEEAHRAREMANIFIKGHEANL